MDLVSEDQRQRLQALERVVDAPCRDADLPGGLPASGMLAILLASVGGVLAAAVGALWLLS